MINVLGFYSLGFQVWTDQEISVLVSDLDKQGERQIWDLGFIRGSNRRWPLDLGLIWIFLKEIKSKQEEYTQCYKASHLSCEGFTKRNL